LRPALFSLHVPLLHCAAILAGLAKWQAEKIFLRLLR